MARPICALSLELEQSMNLQIRIMNIKDHLRYGNAIDKGDDERREKAFGLDKWNEDMMIYFSKLMKEAIKTKDWKVVESIDNEIDIFREKYFKKRKEIQDLELHYEELDDKLRKWIMEYLATCLTKIQDESSKIDLQMIRENLIKKKNKGL